MKKRVLATLLAASMVATAFVGCGKKEDNKETQKETQKESQAEIGNSGAEPLYHFTFDNADEGIKVVERDENNPGANTGATHGLKESAHEMLITNGPVGNCVYLDGKYGLELPVEDKINGNTYTISFWYNADRMGNYTPVFQIGHNIGMNDQDENVKVSWLNFTKADWGTDTKNFPCIWNRNSDNGIWPWVSDYANPDYGTKNWVMVTVVATGEEYNAAIDDEALAGRIRAKLYINGELKIDSTSEDLDGYGGMTPDVFTEAYGNFQALVGINYWDDCFKGYIDDLYIYNAALSDEEVANLYKLGDASVESKAPVAGDEPAEEEQAPVANDHSGVTTTGTVVGATDCSEAFWTAFSDIWAVPAGETVTKTFVNYTSGLENFHNFLAVLQNTATGHAAEQAEGYKEYGVVRADNFGWGVGYDNIAVAETNYNWDTFKADMDGATVKLSVTNNTTTADVIAEVTTKAGTVYTQKYTGIAIDGDLYFCLTVEKAFLDIQ